MTLSAEALAAVQQVVKTGAASDELQNQYSQQMQQETLRNIGKFILAAGGAGMGARGLLGLGQMAARSANPPTAAAPDVLPIEVPIPEHKRRSIPKLAGFLGDLTGGLARTVVSPMASAVGDFADSAGTWAKDVASGRKATTPAGLPYAMPLATLGGMGAAYGGWKGMDHVLNSRHKAQLEDEKQRAKRELHDALMAEYTNEKGASASSLGRDLDRLFDLCEKNANLAYDLPGAMAGTYLTAGGLAAAAAAAIAYKTTKARSKSELLKKTMQQRNRRLFNSQPTAIMARTSDMPPIPEDAVA